MKSVPIHSELQDSINNKSIVVADHARFDAMDIHRGFIMSLMALSHAQEYSRLERYSREDWYAPDLWPMTSFFDLFHQIFISMVVGGGFFMMMGIGIIYLWEARLKEGWPLEKICQYLIKRGLLLIFLQSTILQLFEIIAERKFFIYIGVLFALGACMIGVSLLLYAIYQCKDSKFLKPMHISYSAPLLLLVFITALSQLIIRSLIANNTQASLWQKLFILGGDIIIGGIEVSIDFTPIPWFAAVAFGLIIGQILQTQKEKSLRIFLILSTLFLSVWLVIRLVYITGITNGSGYNYSSLFCMSKYPPGFSYFLWSSGINLVGIALIYKSQKSIPYFMNLFLPFKIFGRCALFFFVLHWFVYYALSLLWPQKIESLESLLTVWFSGLIMLYLMCTVYDQFKHRKPKNSFWRMF